jgi:hypothetical protein
MGVYNILKAKKLTEEFMKERQVALHHKNLIRGVLLPIAGFFLLLIPYTTYIAPFVLYFGGWYLAKWKYGVNKKDKLEDTGESGETYDVEHTSNIWRNTDNGY